MKKYICTLCGYIFDEEQGLPDQGISPGAKWGDVPENFLCLECGTDKNMFELVDG